MTKKIALIGECMVELTEASDQLLNKGFGGDTLNSALYLSRLTKDSVDVHYVTALGTEALSQEIITAWQAEGIKTDLVQRLDDKNVGIYLVSTDDTGERSFSYWRNDSAARYWLQAPETDKVLTALKDFDYIYISGITLAVLSHADRDKLINFLASAKSSGAQIIFDNNYRPALWPSIEETQHFYTKILEISDIALLTADDDELLWGDKNFEDLIARCEAYNISQLIIKRGSEACIAISQGNSLSVDAIKLDASQVKDTTSAGDSFNAGFLAKQLSGADLEESIKAGHKVASTVIQHPGAIIPMQFMPKI